eukprot:SAG11_NODE_33231_length_278_cov_1.016760_1_plen_45_part_01
MLNSLVTCSAAPGFTKGYCGHTDVTGMWEPLFHHGGDWTCNATAN